MAAKRVEQEVHIAQDGADGFHCSGIHGWLAHQHVHKIQVLQQQFPVQS